MPFPETARLELPILLELKSTGGRDQPRYLYERLARFFPQLTPNDLVETAPTGRKRWHVIVQRAARQLIENGELTRNGTMWSLTAQGEKRIAQEELIIAQEISSPAVSENSITHKQAQAMLVEIGQWLGRYAEIEFENYDVVWRDSEFAPRLSHVFEVQISGSVDSALTRLKHAHEAQRSELFLVIADERDIRFAQKRLQSAFHELLTLVQVIGVGELHRLHEALHTEKKLLLQFTARK